MSVLENIILTLSSIKNNHARDSEQYELIKQDVRREVERIFSDDGLDPKPFPPFGALVFPYHRMGAIDSLNLFDLDELIIFSFYWQNRKRYKKVADIGANIGLHSIVLSKCGYAVQCYEPDPEHFKILRRNINLNKCASVKANNVAVSSKTGHMEFTRVLGNTTGSHLSGSKANPYGELEKFSVEVEGITPIIEWAELIKLDAEGHEKEIILATKKEQWLNTDAIIEVENKNNADALFDFFRSAGINMFSQKKGWREVGEICDMPTGYKEGSLFVSAKDKMPWKEENK